MIQATIQDFIPPYNEYYGEIYVTTNLINNKKYVGQTIKPKEKTQWYYGSGVIILKALKKYKKENFIRETLEYCSNRFELNKRERYWIKELNTLHPNGYNITKGGEGINGFKHTNDSKQKMREKSIGRKLTKNHIKNIKKASKERWKDPEYKESVSKKISEAKIGHDVSIETIEKIKKTKRNKLTNIQRAVLMVFISNSFFESDVINKININTNTLHYTIQSLFEKKFIERKKEYNYNTGKYYKKRLQYKYSITDLGKEILEKNLKN